MKNIVFSNHSIDKIEILKKHQIFVDKEFIMDTVKHPDSVHTGYKGRIIAQKLLDENHIIRVIYETQNEDIKIITMYPGRKSRYEKD